ncbi:hypothetical protein FQZ97_784490 [compost metagenome]
MPLLLELKPCTIWPFAGQAQLMTPASAARVAGLVSTGAGAGVAVVSGGGVVVSGWSSGRGCGLAPPTGAVCAPPALPDIFSTWPTEIWLGSLRLFQRLTFSTSTLLARAIL